MSHCPFPHLGEVVVDSLFLQLLDALFLVLQSSPYHVSFSALLRNQRFMAYLELFSLGRTESVVWSKRLCTMLVIYRKSKSSQEKIQA